MTFGPELPILLWDIDGTLVVSGNGGLEHYYSAIQAVIPDAPTPTIDTHGKTDWQNIIELLDAAALDIAFAQSISEELDRLSNMFLDSDRLELLPGVQHGLRQLRDAGYRNGLLTGNSETRSRKKLDGAGLDLELIDWSASFFGDRSPLRSDLTHQARRTYPRDAMLIIGDTPFDGTAAAAAGIPFLAICTGKYGPDAFVGSDAIAILTELDDDMPRFICSLGVR